MERTKQIPRVAFFSGDITRSGGTERVGALIANALDESGEYRIYMVSLAEENKTPAYQLNRWIPRTRLARRFLRPGPGYLPVIWKLRRFLKQNKIDILIDIDGVLDIVSVPAKIGLGVKLISWEHFNYFQTLGTAYRRMIRKLSARHADVIVTLTEEDRGYYLVNEKIHGQVVAIHNPVGYMQGKTEERLSEPEIPMILSAGRLTAMKGFVRIPKIAARLREKYPSLAWQWHIVGEGEQRGEIERGIAEYELEDRVILEGYTGRIESYYEKAAVYVMTSGYEGLPMVLLEAKMYRIPCISFDIRTGPAEIIQDGTDGYLIPFLPEEDVVSEKMVDSIAELVGDRERREEFRHHAWDNLDTFRPDYVISRWKELLAGLVASEPDGI